MKELKIKGNEDGWRANIAMAFYDEYLNFKKKSGKQYITHKELHTISNEAAKNFLNLLLKEDN